MHFRTAIEDERAWWRFVARLVAFAGLAEKASCRSAPVRWLVLWILRHAEAIMEDVVLDAAGMPPADPRDIASAGYTQEDALALAARFMALACMLASLIRATDWNDHWPAPRHPVSAALARQAAGGGRWTPYDTS